MGNLGKDAKDLIIGNDGSDKEPDDFKTELQRAIKAGLITKSDGTLLITSRMNADKLGELISRAQETDVIKAGKEDGNEYKSLEEEIEDKKERKEKEEKEEERRKREAQLAESIHRQKKKVSSGGSSRKVTDDKAKSVPVQNKTEKEIIDEKR